MSQVVRHSCPNFSSGSFIIWTELESSKLSSTFLTMMPSEWVNNRQSSAPHILLRLSDDKISRPSFRSSNQRGGSAYKTHVTKLLTSTALAAKRNKLDRILRRLKTARRPGMKEKILQTILLVLKKSSLLAFLLAVSTVASLAQDPVAPSNRGDIEPPVNVSQPSDAPDVTSQDSSQPLPPCEDTGKDSSLSPENPRAKSPQRRILQNLL